MSSQTVLPRVPQQLADVDLLSLAVEQQGQARSRCNQHSIVFAAHDLGCTSRICHDIPLVDNVAVKQSHRHILPSDYKDLKEHINQLLPSQINRESCSLFASPVLLVSKRDGSLHMCIHYRQLNSATRNDAFPLPRIDQSLDALTGACWFSLLDLARGDKLVPVSGADEMWPFVHPLAFLSRTECCSVFVAPSTF